MVLHMQKISIWLQKLKYEHTVHSEYWMIINSPTYIIDMHLDFNQPCFEKKILSRAQNQPPQDPAWRLNFLSCPKPNARMVAVLQPYSIYPCTRMLRSVDVDPQPTPLRSCSVARRAERIVSMPLQHRLFDCPIRSESYLYTVVNGSNINIISPLDYCILAVSMNKSASLKYRRVRLFYTASRE